MTSAGGKFPELQNVFHDQLDLIRAKRTASIKVSSFPSGVSLANIIEALGDLLQHLTPPVQLERILLSDNNLMSLPLEFLVLCGYHLRYIDLHNNNFSEVPSILGSSCPRLEGLDLSLNRLWLLPRSVFANLNHLKVLLLRDNRFTYLPPILGEIISLEAIGISENPLLLPTIETVRAMSGGVNDLKAFLVSNSAVLEQQIHQQHQQIQNLIPTTPNLARTRSLSDTRSKSLKATRRMGLIINSNKATPEEFLGTTSDTTPSKPERKLLLPNPERGDFSALLPRIPNDAPFDNDLTPITSTYTASTLMSRSTSPVANDSAGSGRLGQNRVRSNTLREINNILEHNEMADPEHKSGAYFRRLSTLQELPSDELLKAARGERNPDNIEDSVKVLPLAQTRQPTAETSTSPVKVAVKRGQSQNSGKSFNQHSQQYHSLLQQHPPSGHSPVHELAVVVKVARKILFSFSELHLSIRRFTGFCADKKLAVRATSLLHTTKGNIDNLVETMEAVEDNGENLDLIMNAMHTCIASFKLILTFLSEHIASFVAKIDVCFIRMVYLTLFGSFSELQNAYRLLNPLAASSKNLLLQISKLLTTASSIPTLDPKTKQGLQPMWDFQTDNLDTALGQPTVENHSLDEIDEKLYQSIDLATSNAQIVFSGLTKAIGKSAMATATSNSAQPINPSVAAKFKELTTVCISSMDITKRLISKLSAIRSTQSSHARRLFWDDISLFLKAIIQTFSSVKVIMKDAPILNEVRQSMANLSKTTKELTILLEASSYKSMSDLLAALTGQAVSSTTLLPGQQLMMSSSNVNLTQLNGTAPVRTPLVATLGAAAAQAILPLTESTHSATGGVPIGLNVPPLVASDVLNTGLHTAPVQSMEQYYAKTVNPFDKIS